MKMISISPTIHEFPFFLILQTSNKFTLYKSLSSKLKIFKYSHGGRGRGRGRERERERERE
jgi:hypothetical protein